MEKIGVAMGLKKLEYKLFAIKPRGMCYVTWYISLPKRRFMRT